MFGNSLLKETEMKPRHYITAALTRLSPMAAAKAGSTSGDERIQPDHKRCKQTNDFALLAYEELAAVHGGVIRVMVDGRTPATMDELALNLEIFKGNIGGPMVL
jgi:hypothetical protein